MPLTKDTLQQIVQGMAPVDLSAIPATAVPFVACNQAAITTTTAVDIKAAVTGKRLWLVAAEVTNITTGETTVVALKDNAGSPVTLAALAAPGLATTRYDFKVPIEVTAGLKVTGQSLIATTGDCYIVLYGYVEA
jgi:hypothetical protein